MGYFKNTVFSRRGDRLEGAATDGIELTSITEGSCSGVSIVARTVALEGGCTLDIFEVYARVRKTPGVEDGNKEYYIGYIAEGVFVRERFKRATNFERVIV